MTSKTNHLSTGVRCLAAGLAAIIAMACASAVALASGPTGEYAPFSDCPYETSGVKQCVLSQSTGGEVVIGSSRTPIKSTLTLQGGVKVNLETGEETFVAAKDGKTLSKTAEPVEGGLADLLPKTSLPEWLWPAYEAVFENGVSGVNAVTELARPASEIGISSTNLAAQEGVALKLPVKIHLENPFLGSECYIGSSSSPVYFSLTTGVTSPPPPNKPISGELGELTLNAESTILTDKGYKLVDNAFSAPAATGCGGVFALIVDPLVNAKIGLPSAAGKNKAILTGNLKRAYAPAVKKSAE